MDNYYKTLRSQIEEKKRPFTSIFKCKSKPKQINKFLVEGHDEIRYNMGKYGPLVVEHYENNQNQLKNLKSKTKHLKHKKILKSKYESPFSYFERHALCKETNFYWYNINEPKILRHYSPTHDYSKKTEKKHVKDYTISELK